MALREFRRAMVGQGRLEGISPVDVAPSGDNQLARSLAAHTRRLASSSILLAALKQEVELDLQARFDVIRHIRPAP